MQIIGTIQNVTVYKCEHCEYTGTMKGVMNAHENDCLNKQLKASKNSDKKDIGNLIDIDIINIKIKEFFIKYNLSLPNDVEFAKIVIDNSFLPRLELSKACKAIFDLNSFKLHNILMELRYSKNYLQMDETLFNKLNNIDDYLVKNEQEKHTLLNEKTDIIVKMTNNYITFKEQGLKS